MGLRRFEALPVFLDQPELEKAQGEQVAVAEGLSSGDGLVCPPLGLSAPPTLSLKRGELHQRGDSLRVFWRVLEQSQRSLIVPLRPLPIAEHLLDLSQVEAHPNLVLAGAKPARDRKAPGKRLAGRLPTSPPALKNSQIVQGEELSP